ncbi:tripartite tricarboxylate transporter permease [Nitratireductor aquimarinus]|uniref:tripartite tricarboxylate transporter permease n=1 Tax=Alphaproteobacteria TaxID=28211 RepID=UPI0019D3E4DF|nr:MULTISPECIES: tripartite tricarboxylate transporter permease [Alphaproteobacteria]MBN7758034.1 tripartite tricarboxylate transporter permease [Nitratireductor aquimarinus]MBY6000796.1 tripartite tricarboxylate transporter permease [Tritonibacter mobilis]MBY6022827.1 tripartite tricarboxylate transporter permease [Nitratireductor sp. DP7N14-4]
MEFLAQGFSQAFSFANIAALVIGTTVGIIVGVLPGLGPMVGMVVLLPFTFSLEPSVALSLLLGVFCGGYFGGAVPAILLRTPGVPSSIVTAFDGFPLTARGEAQTALSAALVGSLGGGLVSIVILIMLAPLLSHVAASFGPPEYLVAALFGVTLVVVSFRDQLSRGLLLLGVGLFLSTIGIDGPTLSARFTFGFWPMQNGFDLVALVLGIFGIGQSLLLLEQGILKTNRLDLGRNTLDFSRIIGTLRYWRTLIRSGVLGTFIGLLPGPGSVLASFISYDVAKRRSSDPESFGKGNPEGCVASEAGNNAVPAGALIPLLTLGIPGEALSAVLLGIFTLNGIYPGPLLLIKEPELISTLYWSMLLINVVAFAMLALLLRPFAMIVKVPPAILAVCVIAVSLIGIYAVNSRLFDCGVALAAGVVGYVLLRLGWPVVALIMGIVMGPIIEDRLRQTLSLGEGNPLFVFGRPVSLTIIALGVAIIVLPMIIRKLRRDGAEDEGRASS